MLNRNASSPSVKMDSVAQPGTTQTNPSTRVAPASPHFALTRWSVVLTAGDSHSPGVQEALEKLCTAYWQPIYAFVRRQGHSPPDAQDLTQQFFARLLKNNVFGEADRSKGKFRSFLLAALKHFLANEWDKARAQKRGGGEVHLSIDGAFAETSYHIEPVENVTPETLFDRRWALTLLDGVLTRLRAEYDRDGKGPQFEALKCTLTGDRRSVPYADIAHQLQTTEGAVKVAVHRLRQRYRAVLRDEIAQTVGSREEVEEEIRALFLALQDS